MSGSGADPGVQAVSLRVYFHDMHGGLFELVLDWYISEPFGSTILWHYMVKQALLCSIEPGFIKCNLETAKIGILPWENMSTTIVKLPKSDFVHL